MKVLVVDDSVVVRTLLKRVISGMERVTEVGVASNGVIACDKLQHDHYDLVILDMEMPELDGLGTLRVLQEKKIAAKCIIFASSNDSGTRTAMEAFRLGAYDVIAKPAFEDFSPDKLFERIEDALVPKIRLLLKGLDSNPAPVQPLAFHDIVATPSWARLDIRLFKPDVLVIASSTGGPAALEQLMSGFKRPLKIPILIAQHMPPMFTKSLADRLSEISGMPANEGQIGEQVLPGHIYVAPGDFHMSVTTNGGRTCIALDQSAPILHVRPAANKLMQSVAKIYGRRALALVMTGMGEDGKEGAMAIKQAGGLVLIQDRQSSVVWGMPGSVANVGAFDHEGDIEKLSNWITGCSA